MVEEEEEQEDMAGEEEMTEEEELVDKGEAAEAVVMADQHLMPLTLARTTVRLNGAP